MQKRAKQKKSGKTGFSSILPPFKPKSNLKFKAVFKNALNHPADFSSIHNLAQSTIIFTFRFEVGYSHTLSIPLLFNTFSSIYFLLLVLGLIDDPVCQSRGASSPRPCASNRAGAS